MNLEDGEDTPITAQALQAHTDALEAADNYLVEVSEDKSYYEQAGFLSRNLIQDISQGSWEDDGKKSTNQTSNVKRCLVENKIECVKGKSFTFSDTDNNYQIYARIFDASGTRVESIGWTNTVTPTNNNSSYALVTIRKKDDSNFTPSDIKNAQIEYGTVAHAWTPYAMSNQGLTKIVEGAIDNEFISVNLFDKSKVESGKYFDSTGAIQPTSGWGLEYIEITPNKQYTVSGQSNVWNAPWLIWLDANKNYINRFRSRNDTLPFTATAPANAKYMGVSIVILDTSPYYELDSFFVEEGTAHVPSNTELQAQVDGLSPTAYKSSGLSFTNCAFVSGGYFKTGRMVCVNLRVTSRDSANSFQIEGLPAYIGMVQSNCVVLTVKNMTQGINDNSYGWIDPSGKLNVQMPTNYAANLYIISAVYLCD